MLTLHLIFLKIFFLLIIETKFIPMSFYGVEFTLIELVVLGLLLLVFIYQIYFYTRYIQGVLRLRTAANKGKVAFQTEQPPVSVIICAKDEVDNLRKYLPFVLQQEYPDFEVIVVNDGSTDETEDLLTDLKKTYSNLRSTFVPVGVTNLSTKKLALTLGIKAAKNDWLLFTDADCMPEDKTWISRMARNFNPGVEFVLGYGAYMKKKGFVNRLITYDTLFIALQYRPGIERTCYELCAGVCEKEDASPLVSAQRELWEETGYGKGNWQEYMVISANPSTHTNLTYCFLATDVELIDHQHLEATEDISVHLLTLEEVRSLLDKNEIMQALNAAPLWKYIANL
jgi:ADP-ribose pyrophosphatase